MKKKIVFPSFNLHSNCETYATFDQLFSLYTEIKIDIWTFFIMNFCGFVTMDIVKKKKLTHQLQSFLLNFCLPVVQHSSRLLLYTTQWLWREITKRRFHNRWRFQIWNLISGKKVTLFTIHCPCRWLYFRLHIAHDGSENYPQPLIESLLIRIEKSFFFDEWNTAGGYLCFNGMSNCSPITKCLCLCVIE